MSTIVLLLLAFTTPSAPARHPAISSEALNTDMARPKLWVYDPGDVSGGSITTGVPNVTGVNAECTLNQAMVLYYDGGSTGVVCVDVAGATVSNSIAVPTTPAQNSTTTFQFAIDAGWPPIPSVISGIDGIPQPTGLTYGFSYFSTTVKWNVECTYPTSWSLATYLQINAETPTATGTPSGQAWASSSLLERLKAVRVLSGGSTNASGCTSETTGRESIWRGNVAGAGGWLSWQRFELDDTKADARVFVGWMDTTSVWTTGEPNSFTNTVYVGCQEADTNLSICSNDNTSTATCATLGANYPCKTDGAAYDLWLYAPPNGGYINWYVERIDSAVAPATGQLTSDLPQNSVQMNWRVCLNTGPTTTTQVRMNFLGMCDAANL